MKQLVKFGAILYTTVKYTIQYTNTNIIAYKILRNRKIDRSQVYVKSEPNLCQNGANSK